MPTTTLAEDEVADLIHRVQQVLSSEERVTRNSPKLKRRIAEVGFHLWLLRRAVKSAEYMLRNNRPENKHLVMPEEQDVP